MEGNPFKRPIKRIKPTSRRPATQISPTFVLTEPATELTPEQIKTALDVQRVFRESLEKDGRGAKLKAQFEALFAEQDARRAKVREMYAKAERERAERQKERDKWLVISLLFLPITILYWIGKIGYAFYKDWQWERNHRAKFPQYY